VSRTWVYNFEWDPAKARLNVKKHGVAFERAATVFQDPHALSAYDQDHSHLEERWITLGRDRSDVLLVVHHTYSEQTAGITTIRLFSARHPTKNETRQYEGE